MMGEGGISETSHLILNLQKGRGRAGVCGKHYILFCAFSSFLFISSPLPSRAAFHVSMVTTSIVSLTVKRNLADVSRDPTPSRSYFDSQPPYLPALIFLSFLLLQLPPCTPYPGTGQPFSLAPSGALASAPASRKAHDEPVHAFEHLHSVHFPPRGQPVLLTSLEGRADIETPSHSCSAGHLERQSEGGFLGHLPLPTVPPWNWALFF
ncbi:unnamed protein product [Nyctereutes procyonoides]|uniref:(raccoon dog) hypothetical protein n=1 Tax=Nyctereutes procyonoides TaxID=34880 RepID=A0A811ZRC3_NYCPR|nr:unnamed protein product [Nyctereutes procyonoides]